MTTTTNLAIPLVPTGSLQPHVPINDAVIVFDGIAGLSFGGITGLTMEWVSTTSVRVTTGAAQIQSPKSVIVVTTAITKSGLSIAANTWYHLYLYLNAGVPDVDVSTTAPATPYSGTARSKTGDTARRYIGSVRSNASSQLINFQQDGPRVFYQVDATQSPFRVLAGGLATAWTAVSLTSVLPVTAAAMDAFIQGVSNTIGIEISTSSTGGLFYYVINPGQFAPRLYSIDRAAIAFYYKAPASGAGAGLFIDVAGYTFTR
jgi:hypothetical protein